MVYDLALAIAGETRPHALATAVLQCLLVHTGSTCGAVLLNPRPTADGSRVTAHVYTARGNPALCAQEGHPLDWPAGLLAGEGAPPGAVTGDVDYPHVLAFALPELGHLVLFAEQAPDETRTAPPLLAPILERFAHSLRHNLESEANLLALRQGEARFRGMLENTSDWFWEVDSQGVYTFSNGKVLDLLGYAPEEVLGRTPFDFMLAEEAQRIGPLFMEIAASRQPFSGLENINRHKNGQHRVLETSGVPIFDGDGNYLGYRGIDRDITARKQAQEALVRAKEASEAASHAKTLFLSSVSHELRTPLNAILGHAQLLGMLENLPDSVSASAHEILLAGNSLLALVNDILELANIQSGALDLQVETLTLDQILADCLARNSGAAQLRKIPLNCPHSCERCHVMADRHYLGQVLDQLVSNAIKFTPEGSQVVLACNADGHGRVRVSVTDGGPGIAPADRAHLFVPFDRLGSEKGQIEGAGIGLAIARHLVESMSGRIGLDSTASGSTFWVELPAAGNNAGCGECLPIRLANADSLQGKRVLIAEDYAPNQTVLQMQLSALGCHTEIAEDGAVALRKWIEGRHDLILSDLNMPVMDGLALTRAVRAHEAGSGRHTPIICITASDHPAEHRTCHEIGVDDLLIKPVSLEALRGKLMQWLGASSAPAPVALETVAAETVADATLDLECLYHVLGETNPEQARTLVATFIRSAGNGLEALTAASPGADIMREMHKQKSSARTVGALRYAKLAETLEKSARNNDAAIFPEALDALRAALDQVETAYASLRHKDKTPAPQALPLAGHGSLLVVDDDPVVLQQVAAMLVTLGVKEVLTASNGHDALQLLSEKNGDLEALICDLSMPAMDGVELIRLFGQSGYRGGLILMSGADEKVLSTVGKLADLQGLRVLGQIQKPVTPAQMTGLLSRITPPRTHKRPAAAPHQASPQAIRDGIDRDEFTVWFQPTVDAITLAPVGVEALARWQHPEHGLLAPEVFIGVAEREGLIGELSQILTSKALMEGAKLHGNPPIFSSRQKWS
jgi:PAS domain S-box-containing protein